MYSSAVDNFNTCTCKGAFSDAKFPLTKIQTKSLGNVFSETVVTLVMKLQNQEFNKIWSRKINLYYFCILLRPKQVINIIMAPSWPVNYFYITVYIIQPTIYSCTSISITHTYMSLKLQTGLTLVSDQVCKKSAMHIYSIFCIILACRYGVMLSLQCQRTSRDVLDAFL